jgi:hypothetical protein
MTGPKCAENDPKALQRDCCQLRIAQRPDLLQLFMGDYNLDKPYREIAKRKSRVTGQ